MGDDFFDGEIQGLGYERGYIDRVIHALPHGRELTIGFEKLKSYVAKKCAEQDKLADFL